MARRDGQPNSENGRKGLMKYDATQARYLIQTALDRAAAEILDEKRLPELLFHYTNAKGLHGILSSKTIWATEYQFLNDLSEYAYAQTVIREHLDQRHDAMGKMLYLSWPTFGGSLAHWFPHYVVSASEDGDSVSQWRSYAGPHDGYAIAFSSEKLNKPGSRLIALLYSPVKQKELLKRVLDAALDAYEGTDHLHQHQVLIDSFSALQYAAYYLKDPSFTGEREWRVVTNLPKSSRDERFRVVGGQIMPYAEIPLSATDIDHIVQGPGSYSRASGGAIERFCSLNGFEGIKVKSTQVPLRLTT